MPKRYPDELVQYLKRHGVKRVIVGHTPHGNCPTVIPNDGVYVIMADTSYSSMKSDAAFVGDNRGDAVCDILVQGSACSVKGRTGMAMTAGHQVVDYEVPPDGGDPHVGVLQPESENVPKDSRFFVKAKLPPLEGRGTSYLLCRVNGFTNTYQEELESQVLVALGAGMPLKKNNSTKEMVSFSDANSLAAWDAAIAEQIFRRLDRDRDGLVTSRELLAACTDDMVRQAFELRFPGESLDETFRDMDADRDDRISLGELKRALLR